MKTVDTCTLSTVESPDVSISFYRFCSCVDCTPCAHVNLEHLRNCILTSFNNGLLTAISRLKWEGTNADGRLGVTKDFVCLGVAWKETLFAPTWFGIATKSTNIIIDYKWVCPKLEEKKQQFWALTNKNIVIHREMFGAASPKSVPPRRRLKRFLERKNVSQGMQVAL